MLTKFQRVFDDHTGAGAGQQVLAIGNPLHFHTTLNVKHMRFCKFGSALAIYKMILIFLFFKIKNKPNR